VVDDESPVISNCPAKVGDTTNGTKTKVTDWPVVTVADNSGVPPTLEYHLGKLSERMSGSHRLSCPMA